MYGPVRTVVWQGSAGDRRPYADHRLAAGVGSMGVRIKLWRNDLGSGDPDERTRSVATSQNPTFGPVTARIQPVSECRVIQELFGNKRFAGIATPHPFGGAKSIGSTLRA